MADANGDSEPLGDGTHEPRECMACRGTGRVISNLGGTPSTIPCPWCEGSGLRPAEIDAQAHWPREQVPARGAGEGADAAAGADRPTDAGDAADPADAGEDGGAEGPAS